jgi:hypothetical protein
MLNVVESDVLVSYGLKIAKDTCITVSSANQSQLSKLLKQFILHSLDLNGALKLCKLIIGSDYPIRKIAHIMSLFGTDPLPSSGSLRTPNQSTTKTKWKQIEDERLIAAAATYGLNNWSSVADFVGNGRTNMQCQQRWTRTVDPNLSKELWNKQEDEMLLDLIDNKNMKQWTKVADHFPNRCDVQCRHRYITIKRIMGRTSNELQIPQLGFMNENIFSQGEEYFRSPSNSKEHPPMEYCETDQNSEFSFDSSYSEFFGAI